MVVILPWEWYVDWLEAKQEQSMVLMPMFPAGELVADAMSNSASEAKSSSEKRKDF